MTLDAAIGEIRLLDELAANAWPALIVQHLDGWRLRFTPGVKARRSNSVLAVSADGRMTVEERLALVSEFYGRRSLPVRFQLSPAAEPRGLDELLAERGFGVEAPVNIQRADLAAVLDAARARPSPGDARVEDRIEEAWLRAWTELFRRGDPEVTKARILERIAPPAGFASVSIEGRVAGVGMGVVERGWLGVFSMGVMPEDRRRGVATAVLAALAEWGAGLGARHAYLQVERENEIALRLYEGLGFSTAYGYHYRTSGSTD